MTLTMKPLVVAVTIISASAYAEDGKHHFDIPAQPLAAALQQLAAQSGAAMLHTEQATAGKTAPALQGDYTLPEALGKLLNGSGLSYRIGSDGTVTIKPVSNPSDATMGAITVTGKAVYYSADPYSKDYAVNTSFAATKADTPLIETPISIQVVPKSVMEDQKSTQVREVVENVSGVRAQPSLGGGVGYVIRGFLTNNIYRNGVLMNEGYFGDLDAANLENIEIIKGPSQLYGRTEPGGMISLTTKKPLANAYYSLEQRFGSYDLYRTQWDAGGPLTSDKSLLYRFSGAYQSNDSFRDFVSTDRMSFNPSITWRPNDATDITFNIEGTKKSGPADFGIPAIGMGPAVIPISRNLGDPNTPFGRQSSVKIGTEINHRFNKDWAIHNRFLASLSDGMTTFVNPAPAFDAATALNQTTGIMQRNIFRQTSTQEHFSTNLDITGKFDIGWTKHDVLFGFDFYRSFNRYGTSGQWEASDPALAINIFNPYPSYGISPATFAAAYLTDTIPGFNRSVIYNNWYGAYFQDQITLWDKLHIMGGGRYDWTETGRGDAATFAAADALVSGNTRRDQGFSPRVGILYEVLDELSIYGNWTTSFGANNSPAANGQTFDPQIGEQFEVGIKTQLFDQRLFATLAYYHLEKDNILVPDLSTANPFDKIANLQRSQGIELDVTGYLTDHFSMIGSYAYTDARIIKDINGGTRGNRMNNVPEHAGSLWLKYDMNGYAAQDGFSAGIGGVAAGSREGDNANSFQLPGYVRVDAFVAYKQKVGDSRVTAQFNIRNLLDKRYYESTDPFSNIDPRLGIYPGAPLMAVGSIKVEF